MKSFIGGGKEDGGAKGAHLMGRKQKSEEFSLVIKIKKVYALCLCLSI